MKSVEKYICSVRDEVVDAMYYAERYVMFKNTRPNIAKMYHDMAEQELVHAQYMQTIGETMMNEFSYIPEETKEEWQECVMKAAEQAGIVRFMLSK